MTDSCGPATTTAVTTTIGGGSCEMFSLGPIDPEVTPPSFTDGGFVDTDASDDEDLPISITSDPTSDPTEPPTTTASVFCTPYQNPAQGDTGGCRCEGVEGDVPFLPSPTDGGDYDPCGYTDMPSPATTSAPAFTMTETNGDIISCASATHYNLAVNDIAECAGATQVVGTAEAIASSHDAATSAVAASESAASASWSEAAASPSAKCVNLGDGGFFDEATEFQIYGINGWAGEDGLDLYHEEAGCGEIEYEFHDDSQDEFQGQIRDTQWAVFWVSFFKAGCVEKAIVSAGGPEITCTRGKPTDDYFDEFGKRVRRDDMPERTWKHGSVITRSSRSSDAPLAVARGIPRP